MKIKREIYDQRILMIIAATLRFVRNGGNTTHLPVKLFVKQYGFIQGFTKTEPLEMALKALVSWVNKSRLQLGKSPSQEEMLKFVKTRI